MKKFFIQNLTCLNITAFAILIWWLIFGLHLSYEPYIWDDLSFFRNYTNEELLGSWIGNWDSDGIFTKNYRPIGLLYYHITYLIFGENLFLFRSFVFLEILVLVILTNQLFQSLNFSKNQIIIFTVLLIFSKIFVTLVAWFTLSVLIFTYILAILSIKFYFLSIEKKNNLYLVMSLLFAACGILAREELYVLPVILFLLYFYKFNINIKNIYFCLKHTFFFFILVFLHMFLRKKFIPEAPHIQFANDQIFFGNNPIQFGGYIQAFKSSFLPMGYLSSSYSDDIQKIFSIFWILLICCALVLLLRIIKFDTNKLKNFFILISLVIVSALPHLAIPRSFGIYLPSIFALMLISILIDKTFYSIHISNYKINLFGKILSILIFVIGISGGVYRSNLHVESVNKFSNSIVQYDARMIYELTNASIPKKRYYENKKHLENLNVYEYNWKKTYGSNMEVTDAEIVSTKIIRNRYHPLRF